MNYCFSWRGGRLSVPQSQIDGGSPQALPFYDLASLTKVIVTFTLLFESAKESRLGLGFLQQPLLPLIPELQNSALSGLSIQDCLEHRTGLPAHFLFFDPPRTPSFLKQQRSAMHKALLQRILSAPIAPTPGEVYSDIGFSLLLVYLERLYGQALDVTWNALRDRVLGPSSSLKFGHVPIHLLNPTESRYPLGEVNDDNAASFHGVAAHAGLFGRVEDVWQWLLWISQELRASPDVFLELKKNGSRFHLGWDSPSGSSEDSHAGVNASRSVRGHLGYTGTCFWWDMESNLAGVLLSNRVFAGASDETKRSVKELRQRFFQALWEGNLSGPSSKP